VLNENGRTLAGVMAELKDELKDFLQTRYDMLRAELRDKASAWKVALPLIAIGIVLLATAWLVLTAALIAIIAMAFYPSPFAYFFAFVIVGVVDLLAGGMCVAFAVRGLKAQGIVPVRTMKVLKEDQVWLQTEARSQI
jgi:VIT1/CCC1 family predicted Fe2+/Mn2+ transporter